jgi:hypothetical protein
MQLQRGSIPMKNPRHRKRLILEPLESRLVLSIFLNINEPVGVTTDASGNVFVSWLDPLNGAIVSKFDSSAHPLGGIITDPGLDGPGYLLTYPAGGQVLNRGQIVDLLPGGRIAVLNPDLSGGYYLGNLQQVNADVTNVYEVYAGQFHDFTGLITPYSANYGEIAVYEGGGYEDWFVTGISNGLPFVERLRWQGGQFQSAQVVATSTAAEGGFNDLPRGIAVNSQGTVLTTFPFIVNPAQDPVDYLVAFGDSFPEDGNFLPYRPLGSDVSTVCFSRGMTTDNSGNFLIATGTTGTSLFGAITGSTIVVLKSDLKTVTGVALGTTPDLATQDVALTSDDSLLYVTIASPIYGDTNEVWVLPYGIGANRKTSHADGEWSVAILDAQNILKGSDPTFALGQHITTSSTDGSASALWMPTFPNQDTAIGDIDLATILAGRHPWPDLPDRALVSQDAPDLALLAEWRSGERWPTGQTKKASTARPSHSGPGGLDGEILVFYS